MGIELESETRIVVGRLHAPADPDRPWWWQTSTRVEGDEITMAGLACTENEAILEAASRALQVRLAQERSVVPADKRDMSAVGDNGQVFGG